MKDDDLAYRGHEYEHIMFDDLSSKEMKEMRQFEFDLEVANYAIRNWRIA